MTRHRVLNIALACAAALAAAVLLTLPGPALDQFDDIKRGQQSIQDAQRDAQRQARFERAAQRLCGGENSVFQLLADNEIQCLTHRGHKTITAKVAL